MAAKTTPTAEPDGPVPETAAAVPAPPAAELVSDSGGVFINTSQVDLVLLQPATLLKPDRVVELEYDPGHRDLRRATPAEIKAARDAEAAEQAAAEAASSTTSTGQEQ
jgi:hypothetical protein